METTPDWMDPLVSRGACPIEDQSLNANSKFRFVQRRLSVLNLCSTEKDIGLKAKWLYSIWNSVHLQFLTFPNFLNIRLVQMDDLAPNWFQATIKFEAHLICHFLENITCGRQAIFARTLLVANYHSLIFFLISGEVHVYTAVQGSSVDLPCNITPPIFTDRVRLVLYFRNDTDRPIYT